MSDTPVTAISPGIESEDQTTQVSAATRHLCTGVYVRRKFRDTIIRRVHNDPRHRLAPSYGFDLVPVVRHAWRSWLLDIAYLAVLAAIPITGLLLGSTLAVIIVGSAVVFLLLLHTAICRLGEVVVTKAHAVLERWGVRAGSTQEKLSNRDAKHSARIVRGVAVGLVIVAGTPFLCAFLMDQPLLPAVGHAVVIGGALVMSAITGGIVQLRQLVLLKRDAAAPRREPSRRLAAIAKQQDPQFVVYDRPPHRSGDLDPLEMLTQIDAPSPFLGTGKLVNRWLPPLTVQLIRPGEGSLEQREYVTPPFRAHNLVEALREALAQLDSDTGTESLPGIRIRDRVYVAAADFHPNYSSTRFSLGKFEMRRIIDDHKDAGHHFLETSVPILGGELVATVLIRVSLKGRSLSLDVATCALTRTPEDFQLTDRFRLRGVRALLWSVTRSVVLLPKDITRVWQLLGAPLTLGRAALARRRRTDITRRWTNRPVLAVREEVADVWTNTRLDRTTIYDYMKIIEQRVLKAAEDFLKDHGVDTSKFENQATNIINSGVLNMGGDMSVGQMAAGLNAQIINSTQQAEGAGA